MKVKLILLPTNGASPIHLQGETFEEVKGLKYAPTLGFPLFDKGRNFQHNPQHLYLIDNEEIKEGDWLVDVNTFPQKPIQVNKEESDILQDGSAKGKRVVATTDAGLNLPLIPDQFIEYYVAMQGAIDKVEIEGVKDGYVVIVEDLTSFLLRGMKTMRETIDLLKRLK